MSACSQPKCPFDKTGICLEGHAKNCPHLLPSLSPAHSAPISEGGISSVAPLPEPYRFYSGEKLTLSEASRLMNDRDVRVIFCAGAQWAGKTTFLARIGEMFRTGAFKKFSFAGSKTLCGFERATWLATINSGTARPETPRTRRRENNTFLHLCVQLNGEVNNHREILIGDLAGETFPDAVASQDFCEQQRGLISAEHLILFLDSLCLVDLQKRHSERDNALGFIKQVIKVKPNSKKLNVHIVFSRWDYVLNHGQREMQEAFCAGVRSDFQKKYGDSFADMTFSYIAARPGSNPPTNDEIQSLFARCMEDSPQPSRTTPKRSLTPGRDFSAFGLI